MTANIDDLRRVYPKLNDAQKIQAASLGQGFKRYGTWTEKQQRLVDLIVNGVDRPESFTKMTGILDLFTNAKGNYPTMRLQHGDMPLKLYRAGEKSKTPGAVNVVEWVRHGDGEDGLYFGKVMTDGTWRPSREHRKGLVEFLCELADDPAGVAALYGQSSGVCSFCAKELTDARSVEVGYGPKCAAKWSLPWGEKK